MTTTCDLPIDLSTKSHQSHHHHRHEFNHRHHKHNLHEEDEDFHRADNHHLLLHRHHHHQHHHHLQLVDQLQNSHLLEQTYATQTQLDYQSQLGAALALNLHQQSQLSRLYAATSHHRHQLEQLEIQIELARRSTALQSSPPLNQTYLDRHQHHLKSHALQYQHPQLALHIAVRQEASNQSQFGLHPNHQSARDELKSSIINNNNTIHNQHGNHQQDQQMPPVDLHRSSTSSAHSTSSSSSASISSTSLCNTTNNNTQNIVNTPVVVNNSNIQNSNPNDNRYSQTPVNMCSNPNSPHSQTGIINDKKKINRPLTGKHVKHGTGASIQTLATLRNVLKQRQQTVTH